MAEALLRDLLNGRTPKNLLFKWLQTPRDQQSNDQQFTCSQGEFVSHFLNYIHETAPCHDGLSETPRKVHTPKSIRKVHVSKSEGKVRRRSALFPDLKPLDGPARQKVHLAELNCSRGSDCSIPVSPIYARGHTSTPRYKGRESKTLADFMVAGKPRKSRHSAENVEPPDTTPRTKRINPTNISRKLNSSFGGSGNSFDFKEVPTEICTDSALKQRTIMVEERLRISELKKGDAVMPVSQVKAGGVEIAPDFDLVVHKEHLERLIVIYICLLSNNFVLNIASEIYFLLSLALSKQYSTDHAMECVCLGDVPPNQMFPSIHNTVYLAVRVLETQTELLKLLDKPCLRFMCSNERLRSVSTRLSLCTVEMCREDAVKDARDEKIPHVCFISETDNRENFPSDLSFHAFKKQRDLFYEILRVWEQQHLLDGWNYAISLGGKIKTLLALYDDAANFRHFCRLFKAQLLTACGKIKEEGVAEDELSFLSTIANVNSEKLSRLRDRLVTKASSNGINALPTFPGHQEFYKEFIITASKHVFNVHLRNTFIQEILELNNTKFSCNELDYEGSSVDEETKRSYLHCLKSLRLLAKFLGFLESMPYRKHTNVPDRVISVEIKTRSWEQPAFDLKQIITSSCSEGALVLTIPWITKYLAMLDYVTLRLPYFDSVLEMLFELFRMPGGSLMSVTLTRLCLGWLFELPHFPSELYYAWYTRRLGCDTKLPVVVPPQGLDSLDIVDRDVVHTCCPHLGEFKTLLQYNCARNGTITVKHITPVSAVESPSQVSEKRLKLQLEDAFFGAHQNSVRETVDFVGKRVASACVKSLCATIVPRCKGEAVGAFKVFLAEERRKLNPREKFTLEVKPKCADFLQDRLKLLRDNCEAEMDRHVALKVEATIQLLLSDEETPQTKKTCAAIAVRSCRDRVRQWTNTHINENVFSKEFDLEFSRATEDRQGREAKSKLSQGLPTLGRPQPHDPATWSAATIVNELRMACVEALQSPPATQRGTVLRLLDYVCEGLSRRCDVNDSITHLITRLLLDYVVILISREPQACDTTTLERFVSIWTGEGADRAIFKTIMCPRNVRILEQSPQPAESWRFLATFVALLLRKKLLDCDEFEAQCLSIYRQNWGAVVLKRLSLCFQSIVQEYGRTACSLQFSLLLTYLSDYCSDLEF